MLLKNNRVIVFLVVLAVMFSGLTAVIGMASHTNSAYGKPEFASVPQNGQIGQYPDGNNAQGGAYDPYNQELYVTNYFSNNVTVINAFSGVSTANVSVGTEPKGVAYVPQNHDVYVDNYGSNNISVISSVTNTVIATINLSESPQFSAYDPQNQTLYVSGYEYGVGLIWVLNVTTNKIASTLDLPSNSDPYGLAFDPYNGYMYIADFLNNVVYALSPAGNIVSYIAVGQSPYGIAFDPVNKMLYVTDYDQNGIVSGSPQEYNVTIINTLTSTAIKNVVPGTEPEGIAYDPVNGYVYVANYLSGNISVLSPATESIIQTLPATIGAQGSPSALVYDPVMQQMISVNDISTIDATLNYNSAGGYAALFLNTPNPNSVAYDPLNHLMYVSDTQGPNVNVYTLDGVLVKSIAVPGGSVYSLTYGNNTIFAAVHASPGQIILINPDTNTVTKNVTLPNTTINAYPNYVAYDSLNNTLFISFPNNNDVGVMNLSTYDIVKNLEVGTAPSTLTYSNITNQVYVGQQDANIHIINASSYVNIYPYGATGSNPSQAVYDPYTNSIYIANRGNDSMFVINESRINYLVNEATPYYTVPLGSPQQSILLNPSNGLIYIMQSGTQNVTIFNPMLNETVGSISSPSLSNAGLMTYIPGSQIIMAADSSGYLEEISPAQTSNISIGVGNLIAGGGTWSLQIQPSLDTSVGQVYSSTQSLNQSVSLPLSDGTYIMNLSFSAGSVAPIHTWFVVNGSSMHFDFYPVYNVTFTESGLPTGTSWTLKLSNGEKFTTSHATMSFPVENDTQYSYTLISGNSSYAGKSGTFTLSGPAEQVQASFSLLKYTLDIKETGLASGTKWFVKLDGVMYNSTTDEIAVQLPNGTYSYTVVSETGYSLTNGSGNVTVSGGALVSNVKFSQVNSGLSPIDIAIVGGVIAAVALTGAAVYVVRIRGRK